MNRIRVLPKEVVEKIAAGEVVERPASVVKELVENAIDAGAKRIEIELEEGGKKRIRVTDDGTGISREELQTAVASHATSKLENEEDLFDIETLGFRGEALSSIAAVSRLRIISRMPERDTGAALEVDGGTLSPARESGAPVGTSVEVRNLFFNVPARRKFLKSDRAELGQVSDWGYRFALCWPGIEFLLRNNANEVFHSPPAKSLEERILHLFGKDLAEGLNRVVWKEGVSIEGWVSKPGQGRGNAKYQYVFLNGRFIRDRVVIHAVRQAYETLMERRRHPVVFLHLHVPPDEVDVNVHPTKTEVRFRNSSDVHRAVYLAVKQALQGEVVPDTAQTRPPGPEHIRVNSPRGTVFEPGSSPSSSAPDRDVMPAKAGIQDSQDDRVAESSSSFGFDPHAPIRYLQIHDTYLVVETEDGFELLDQHALHERILYEELSHRTREARVESQPLLIPEVLDFPPESAAAVLEHHDLLSDLGFDAGEFGAGSVVIRSVPGVLADRKLREFFDLFLDRAGEEGSAPSGSLKEKVLHLVACQAAVRAGDPLAEEEVRALLHRRSQVDHPSCCQHGRPTSRRFSLPELEKLFLRR